MWNIILFNELEENISFIIKTGCVWLGNLEYSSFTTPASIKIISLTGKSPLDLITPLAVFWLLRSHLDFECAYLNGKLNENGEIFMEFTTGVDEKS